MDNRSNYTEWKPYKGTWYRKAIQYHSSYKEKELQGEFTAKKIRYLREVQFKGLQTENGGWYRADFFLPDKDMIVEYDGDYHLLDYQKKVDQIKDKYYKSIGLTVVRINKHNYKEQLSRICGGKFKKKKKSNKLDQKQLALLLSEAKHVKNHQTIDDFIKTVKEINRNKK